MPTLLLNLGALSAVALEALVGLLRYQLNHGGHQKYGLTNAAGLKSRDILGIFGAQSGVHG